MSPVLEALQLSLLAACSAIAIITVPAIALARIQARHQYPGKTFVDALIFLPMVLPPSVVGFLLVLLWGRAGLFGSLLYDYFGIQLSFSLKGVILAQATVAFPILTKIAQVALEAVPIEMEECARVDGANRLQVLRYITFPIAGAGLFGALSLAFARAMGEFGATLMFAGNVEGETTVLPLQIYTSFQGGHNQSAYWASLLLAVSSLLIVGMARRRVKSTVL